MFELRQLRYFVSVAEHEHVSRAAVALNLTQSPLSRQIMDLEAKLELVLFHREKKRLRLTSTGRDFLKQAKELLAQADRLERYAKALASGQSGTLIVGYVDGALHAGLVSSVLRATKSKYAELKVQLLPMRSSVQFQKLLTGEIDIALTYSAPYRSDALVAHHIHTEEYLLAVPSSYGWAGPVMPSQLDDQPLIWLPAAAFPAAREKLTGACASAGFHPDISFEATSPLAALELVTAGIGVALIQSSLQRMSPEGVSFFAMPKMFKERIELFAIHRCKTTSTEDIFMEEIACANSV